MSEFCPITVAYGDGIGPEIMTATLNILNAAGAKLSITKLEIGQTLYNQNYSSGIDDKAWEILKQTNILLKAPITTPQGSGVKSLNVTLRKFFGLYANIRPAISYAPFVVTSHPQLDLTIIRENEEDLYTGIEYRQTQNMYQSIKLVSKQGCEQIIRYAFEYALINKRNKVTCLTKDNIMKMTDGLFHQIFNKIALEYPSIKTEHLIIDIGTAKLATCPERFDVIVTLNLYGDIISDVVAEVSGSVGLAGSANIGNNKAMFEAVHGSAPDIADKNIANPSGLLNAAIMMLCHIGQVDVANKVENAWKKTLEDKIFTADLVKNDNDKIYTTSEFTEAVIQRLGLNPNILPIADHKINKINSIKTSTKNINIDVLYDEKKLVGFDVFIDYPSYNLDEIVDKIKLDSLNLKLESVSAKGMKLWPPKQNHQFNDHWCLRFKGKDHKHLKHVELIKLIENLIKQNIDFIKIENLYEFNDSKGYSLAQGE